MPYGVDGQWYANQWDASAKGDYISAGYLAQQEADAAALARLTSSGTTGKYIAPKAAAGRGGGSSVDLSWINSLFYFFFWFIPKLVFYYMPIKHFFKFLLFAVFAAAAYGLSSDTAKQMGSDVQWALQPQSISYKPSEYYGISPKYLKQYRKLSAKGLINASGSFNRSYSQDAAFYAVLKERLLADPKFFNLLQSSEGLDYTMSTCKHAKRYFFTAYYANKNMTREQRVSLRLEEGYFNFMKTCAGGGYTTPASSFINDMFMLSTEPNVKPDYDRIYQDLGFQISHYREKASYILYALAFIIFSVIIIQSHRIDCEKRAAKELAEQEVVKAMAEAKKTETEKAK
jgi:hypothetical protein